jgi:hypothetical protein
VRAVIEFPDAKRQIESISQQFARQLGKAHHQLHLG